MTAFAAPGRARRTVVARVADLAAGRRERLRSRRRQLAAVLVFVGGVATGAGSMALLIPPGNAVAREDVRLPASSAYGLPATPAARGGSVPAVAVAKVRHPSAPPLEVVLPTIGVRSRLLGLRLNLDGTVQVPDDYGVAGWYRDGPAPGDPGAALILGHVDSTTGPAIFYRLGELRRGDPVLVRRADGTTARFVVERLAKYPKSRFPAAKVYTATARPELRLVTCTGNFAHGHYLDNLVVFANQAVSTPARKPAAKPAKKSVVKTAHGSTRKPAQRPAEKLVIRFALKDPV